MKKFYETPMVEFTVFDVEDVITTSAIAVETAGMTEQQIDALIAEIESAAVSGTPDVLGNYNSYSW